jgi:hypothetical protein
LEDTRNETYWKKLPENISESTSLIKGNVKIPRQPWARPYLPKTASKEEIQEYDKYKETFR